jgi:cytochrome bd-type quinol oxidase subunit 2
MYTIFTIVISIIGTLIFIGKWYLMNMNQILHDENLTYIRKYIFTIAFAILFANILLNFQDVPHNYDSELEIQRSIEENANYIAAMALGIVLFIKESFQFSNKKNTKKLIRYPIIFVSIGFMYILFIMFYVNLPKTMNAVYLYRNIISACTNLSVMNILTGIIIFLAIIN